MILEEQLPEYDVSEKHAIRIASPPRVALAAARALTPREVPLFTLLMALRGLPTMLSSRRRLELDQTILDQFVRLGFSVLGEAPDEIAVGGVGRFWRLDGGIRRVAGQDFARFSEPGYAKAGFHFRAEPEQDGGSILRTETRVLATDASARRKFGRYWRVVRPGSGAIRIAWLRAIRSRAERR